MVSISQVGDLSPKGRKVGAKDFSPLPCGGGIKPFTGGFSPAVACLLLSTCKTKFSSVMNYNPSQ
jgi:hypothetical protein